MSYQTAVRRRRRRGRVVSLNDPDVLVRRARGRARVLTHSTPNYRPDMSGPTRYLSGDDGLGFSLRPPSWARKAFRTVKRNITLKRALVAGAVVGAAFIPGVGPAALAAARAAGGFAARGIAAAGRGIFSAGGAIERGVVGLFKRKPKYGPFPQPSDQPSDQGQGTPGTPSGGGAPSGGGGGGGGAPSGGGTAPDQGSSAPYGGGGAPAGTYGPQPPPDGGGDGGDDGSAPLPEETATTDETATAPAQAGALPVLLGLGALALLARRR